MRNLLAQYRRQLCVARLPAGTREERNAALTHGADCAESHDFEWAGCAVGPGDHRELVKNVMVGWGSLCRRMDTTIGIDLALNPLRLLACFTGKIF